MAYLELGERNRKKYPEVPERITFENHQFGMRAIKALRKQTGFDYDMLTDLLRGVPRMDSRTGDPVYELDEHGQPRVDEDGQPVFVTDLDEDAVVAAVWLILWSAGHKYDWSAFDINAVGLKLVLRDEEGEPGKAEANTTTESAPET